jgi:hypothetical protein
MNRRQLLVRGALLAALAPVVRAAAGAPGDAAAPVLAVHDPAYRRSGEFARGLQDRGARVLSLEPDAMAAWHGTLRTACAASPSLRLIGLTTHTDFMVLRDLARTAGLVPLATRDEDAGGARRRATLIAWVLAPRARLG